MPPMDLDIGGVRDGVFRKEHGNGGEALITCKLHDGHVCMKETSE